jgi:hypothetical protein
MRGRVVAVSLGALLAWLGTASISAWGPQGHRVAALLASNHLSESASREIDRLLQGQSLSDVAGWADQIVAEEPHTRPWHYINLPSGATAYERMRDCPSPSRTPDAPRDCVVDRISFFERQLANRSLDANTRARALKFLVHFVADVHQPFHALGTRRGGNDVSVRLFGSAMCGRDGRGRPRDCTLHSAWDGTAVNRRRLRDDAYVRRLSGAVAANGWQPGPIDPAIWALEANRIAVRAVVPEGTNLEARYFARFDREIDEQLAKGGMRLAALLNRAIGR